MTTLLFIWLLVGLNGFLVLTIAGQVRVHRTLLRRLQAQQVAFAHLGHVLRTAHEHVATLTESHESASCEKENFRQLVLMNEQTVQEAREVITQRSLLRFRPPVEAILLRMN